MVIGPQICTASGQLFNFERPSLDSIRITDIAAALSKLCRFTGHTKHFYSVAQHSVLVSHVVPERLAFTGLLHDAAEAYIGDIAKPLKNLLPDYEIIEQRVEAIVMARFHIALPLPQEVKDADMVLLATEKRDLMRADKHSWHILDGVEPLPQRIVPMGPDEAYEYFMDRYRECARFVT